MGQTIRIEDTTIKVLTDRIKELEKQCDDSGRELVASIEHSKALEMVVEALRELRKRDEAEFIERAESNAKREMEDLQRIALLEAALSDAIDSYEEYAQYAGEYLCKKHRVDEDIAEKRALLQEQGDE